MAKTTCRYTDLCTLRQPQCLKSASGFVLASLALTASSYPASPTNPDRLVLYLLCLFCLLYSNFHYKIDEAALLLGNGIFLRTGIMAYLSLKTSIQHNVRAQKSSVCFADSAGKKSILKWFLDPPGFPFQWSVEGRATVINLHHLICGISPGIMKII